jgi:deoxyadenosine/deoxycytidine kinase
MYVAIAGTIGAGKSTLTHLLAQRYNLGPVLEAVDENPYLGDFYADMGRWAFHSQIFFLATRLRHHLAWVNTLDRVVQDRTVDEDAGIFAHILFEDGLIDERDFATYTTMYEAVRQALRQPDLLVYLKAGLGTVRRHIALRGRDYERGVDDAYLLRIGERYERWIEGYDAAPIVTIDVDRFDFVARPADREAVFEALERHGLTPQVVR